MTCEFALKWGHLAETCLLLAAFDWHDEHAELVKSVGGHSVSPGKDDFAINPLDMGHASSSSCRPPVSLEANPDADGMSVLSTSKLTLFEAAAASILFCTPFSPAFPVLTSSSTIPIGSSESFPLLMFLKMR